MSDKLPDRHFERVKKRWPGHVRTRECSVCTKRWKTCEIPLAEHWPKATHPHNCPRCNSRGTVLSTYSSSVIRRDKRINTPGFWVAEFHGGQYRRYKCGKGDCPSRWTTVEFDGSGYAVDDILYCPRCGERGKPYTPTKEEKRRAQQNRTDEWHERIRRKRNARAGKATGDEGEVPSQTVPGGGQEPEHTKRRGRGRYYGRWKYKRRPRRSHPVDDSGPERGDEG